MTTPIELDLVLDKLVGLEAKRQGISKSKFVSEALERVLGMKNPYDLLQQVRDPAAYRICEPATCDSENVSAKLKEKLRAKHSV